MDTIQRAEYFHGTKNFSENLRRRAVLPESKMKNPVVFNRESGYNRIKNVPKEKRWCTVKDVPEEMRLSNLYEGEGSAELTVKVLRGDGSRDILDQYVRFCEIADANREKYGRKLQAVEETIRQCMAEGILAPFLASRQKEVHDIMVTLFNEQTIMDIYKYNIAKEAKEEGWQEGREEGRKKGREEERENSIRKVILIMRKASMDRKFVIQQLMDNFGLSAQAAEEKVNLYWS